MIKSEYFSVTLFFFGVALGAVLGFWSTLALVASLYVLRAAKNYWREKPVDPEPQTA